MEFTFFKESQIDEQNICLEYTYKGDLLEVCESISILSIIKEARIIARSEHPSGNICFQSVEYLSDLMRIAKLNNVVFKGVITISVDALLGVLQLTGRRNIVLDTLYEFQNLGVSGS